MAVVKPFNGIRYNADIVDLTQVVAPPYDIISREERDELYEHDARNCVRLMLGKDFPDDDATHNKYSRSRDFFITWLAENILQEDEEKSFYVYEQRYEFRGQSLSQIGFFGRLKIEEHGKGSVYPHEVTLPKPKEDRLNLVRSVQANMSPVFMFYDDDDDHIADYFTQVRTAQPEAQFTYAAIEHLVWRIADPVVLEAITKAMSSKEVFIADGHHRYEVALTYCNEIEASDASEELKEAARYVMCYFSALKDDAWAILPIHRLVSGVCPDRMERLMDDLETFFEITPLKDPEEMFARLDEAIGERCTFGIYFGDKGFFLLELRDEVSADDIFDGYQVDASVRTLDVAVLHTLVFCKLLGLGTNEAESLQISYIKDEQRVLKLVEEGKQQCAIFVNPPRVDNVRMVAKAGGKMPPKSTYFYPKPLTGLVINPLTPLVVDAKSK